MVNISISELLMSRPLLIDRKYNVIVPAKAPKAAPNSRLDLAIVEPVNWIMNFFRLMLCLPLLIV